MKIRCTGKPISRFPCLSNICPGEHPGYCLLGGGEPDGNLWLLEGGTYKWSAGGDPVQPGNYLLTIEVPAGDGQVGTWLLDVYIALP